MQESTPRYAPERSFPPYAFLPGQDPHPTRNPEGHSFGHEEEPAPYRPPEDWREIEEYLYGVDLYNHGYLWEAHEAWEGLWHVAKVEPVHANFLQGLIQCAAAALKVRMRQPGGLAKLSMMGTGKLSSVIAAEGPDYMGVDVPDFIQEFMSFAGSSPEGIDGRPLIVLQLEED